MRGASTSIIDPLEARTNRPKKKSRCPTKKISPPTKSFETFNDRLSVDDLAWELVAKNDRRSSVSIDDARPWRPPHSM